MLCVLVLQYVIHFGVTACDTLIHLFLRLRQSSKKKKKINLHVKFRGAKKDEMKLALLKLKGFMQLEQTDGVASNDNLILDGDDGDSESDRGSTGPDIDTQ